ncbi:MAG: hypothetical protein J0L96_00030 [Anaerolineae bacterium]|nr:hypothetical protein [Anaerolineae bacterium]
MNSKPSFPYSIFLSARAYHRILKLSRTTADLQEVKRFSSQLASTVRS